MHTDAEMKQQIRILLVHLVSMGDCLFVTALARQIKQDYPGCHLTWAISDRCSPVILHNPYIDEIWEIFSEKMRDNFGFVWEQTKKEALARKEKGLYDIIFFTQIIPDNLSNYDGTIRSSTFRNYPNPITVPVSPIICLTEKEIENVRIFAMRYNLQEFDKVILFECSPQSKQSPVNVNFALELSRKIVDGFEDCVILLTSNQKINTGHNRIIDASEITFRENAELSKYCNLLIGCSSGITWLLTSEWAKKIPTIQILNTRSLGFSFASVSYDLSYWGQSTEHIIEITKSEDQYIFNCIKMTLECGVENARNKYNQVLKPDILSLDEIIKSLPYEEKFKNIIKILRNFYNRNKDPLMILIIPYVTAKVFIGYLLNIIKKL